MQSQQQTGALKESLADPARFRAATQCVSPCETLLRYLAAKKLQKCNVSLTKFQFPPIIAFMTSNSVLRPFACVLLLNVFLPVLFPRISSGAARDNLITSASAALDDELYEIAEQNIRQYLGAAAGTNQPQNEHIIILARSLHGQKRYPEMLALLKQNLKASANSSLSDDFLFWLALAHYDNFQLAEALALTVEFEKSRPDSALVSDIIRLKTKILLKLGRTPEAIETLRRLIGEHKDENETVNDRLFLGRILADLGQTNEACTILEKILAFAPDTSAGQKCRTIIGRVYMGQKEWNKARLTFEPLINQDNIPDNFRLRAIVSLSEIAVAQTNLSEALNIIEKGAHLMPRPPCSHELALRKGIILLKMNKTDEGTALIHDYVGAQTNKIIGAKVQLELAQTLLTGGIHEKALAEFDILLESFAAQADTVEAYRGKGTALFNLARYYEAATAFTRADEASDKPEDKLQYRYRSADAFFALSRFKTAAETYTQAANLLPDSYQAMMALFQTAECQVQMENTAEAEKIFWKIYDADPNDELAPRALLRIADIILQRNEMRAAETIYSLIYHDYQDLWQARSLYGLALIAYRAGRFAEALQRFDEALRLAGNAVNSPPAGKDEIAADAAYMSGWCYFMLNKIIDARNRFSGIAVSYPRSSKAPEALFWLGENDYNNRRYNSAETFFRRLATDCPNSPVADDALFWAGRSALQLNEFRRGRDYFSLLIKNYPLSPRRPEARYFQGIALCELGQFDAAILILNEIIKQYPDHNLAEPAAFKKADCQFILGSNEPKRYEEAVNSYQIILDRPDCSPPSRLQAKYKAGRCLEKLGKTNEAFAQYMGVVYSYLQNQDQTPPGNLWFTRAAFNAAGIMEEQQLWRRAVNIYERVVEADIPASRDAQERIDKLRSEHWLFFY